MKNDYRDFTRGVRRLLCISGWGKGEDTSQDKTRNGPYFLHRFRIGSAIIIVLLLCSSLYAGSLKETTVEGDSATTALDVNQTSSGKIVEFKDNGTGVFRVDDGGAVTSIVAGNAQLTVHSNTDTPTADSKLFVIKTGSSSPVEKFWVDEDGDIQAAGNLTVTGIIAGPTSVDGTTASTFTINNDTAVNETSSLAFDVGGSTEALSWNSATSEFDLTDDFNVTGSLDVTGAVGIDGNFDINTNKFNVIAANGNTTIAGTLAVTGNVDANSGLDVSGAALTIANQAITQTTGGQVTFAGNLDANAGIDVTGNANISGNAIIGGDVTVDTDTFKIDSTKNMVGIGTIAPEAKLDIIGPLRVGTAGDSGVGNDFILTNIDGASIKSYGPLTVQSGGSNDNYNLTLKGTGTGKVYVEDDLQIADGYDLTMQNLSIPSTGEVTFGGDAVFSRASADTITTGTGDNLTVAGNLVVNGTSTLGDGTDNLTVNTNQLFVQGASGNVGIGTVAPTALLAVGNNAFKVASNGTVSAGTWQGTAVGDTYVADALTISGGTVNNTIIGGTVSAAGTFTNLTASGTLNLPANSVTDAMVSNTLTASDLVAGSAVVADSEVVDALTISGGTINATSVGATVASTGVFTTLSSTQGANLATASGNVGIGTISPVAKLAISGASVGLSNIRLTNTSGPQSWELNPYTVAVSNTTFAIRDATGGQDEFAIKTDGNVGIGTVTPAYKLDIIGDLRASTGAILGSISGNVGIGTTSPTAKLHVDAGTAEVKIMDGLGSGFNGIEISGASSALSLTGSDDFYISSLAQGFSIYDATGNTGYRVVINNDGNFGIGTSVPIAKLDILGNAKITGSLDVSGTVSAAGLAGATSTSGTSNQYFAIDTDYNEVNPELRFQTGSGVYKAIAYDETNTEFDFNDDINVTGIVTSSNGLTVSAGTVSLPADSITDTMVSNTLTASDLVAGSAVVADAEVVDALTISGGTINATSIGATVASTGAFTTLSSTGTTSLATNSGNVGIGTTGPTRLLDVKGLSYFRGQIFIMGANLLLDSGQPVSWGDSTQSIRGTNGYGLIFTTNSSEQMRITSVGNVGIGTTAPTSKLHGLTAMNTATGNEIAYQLAYTTNKATSGNDTGLLIEMTDTLSPGTSRLIDLQVGGGTKFNVDNAGNTDIQGNLVVAGDLTIQGTQTILNTQTVEIESNELKLNRNVTGAPSLDASIIVERGTSSDTYIKWDEANDKWVMSNGTSVLDIANPYTAGDGLTLTGQDFDVNVDASTIEISGDTLQVKDSGITSAKIAADTIVAGDIATSAVETTEILDGTIANVDINASAGIAGTKIAPDFGSQNIITTGNVGIGTAAPSEKLEVYGGEIEVTSNMTHVSGDLTSTDGILRLYNNREENVAGKGAVITFEDNFYSASYIRTTRAAIKGGTDTAGNTADGFLAFYTDSGTANSMQERMRINNDGYVGIGTINPGAFFTVGNDAFRVNSSGTVLAGTWNGTALTDAYVSDTLTASDLVAGSAVVADSEVVDALTISGGTINATSVGATVASTGAFTTLSSTQGTNLATASGNVGIGTTGPGAKLHVVGTVPSIFDNSGAANPQTALRLRNLATPTNGVGSVLDFQVYDSGSNLTRIARIDGVISDITDSSEDSRLDFYTVIAGSETRIGSVNTGFSIGNSYATIVAPSNGAIIQGNVGIGTTNPVGKLYVKGDSGVNALYVVPGDTPTSPFSVNQYGAISGRSLYLGVGSSGSSTLITTNDTNEDLYIDPNGTGNILLDGNVGIGTIAPSKKLYVDGDIYATGSISGASVGSSMTVKEVDGAPLVSNVTTLEFDQSTGLIVTDQGSNIARIGLGSHWKELYVGGASVGMIPTGEETLNLVAGNDLDLTANSGASPKSLTFALEDDIDATQIRASSASGLGLYDDGSNVGVFIKDGGNVGIGTIAPISKLNVISSDTTGISKVLQLAASIQGASAAGNGVAITFGQGNTYYTKIATVYEQSNPSYLNPALVFYTMNQTYLADSEIERLRISSAGNVGIGTNVPMALLAVGNNAFKVASNGTVSAGTWNGTAIVDTYVADTLTISGGTINNTVIGGTVSAAGTFTNLTASGTLSLPNNSVTDAMVSNTLTASDLVAGSAVVADSEVIDALTISGGTINATSVGATVASTGAFTTLSSTQGTNLAAASGNVGIGTVAPGAKLAIDMVSADTYMLGLNSNVDSSGHWIRWTESGAEKWVVGHVGSQVSGRGNNFEIVDGSSNTRLAIQSTGNVGIGTTAIGNYKLNVNGPVNISGALDISGTVTAAGLTGATSTTGTSNQYFAIDSDYNEVNPALRFQTGAGTYKSIVYDETGTEFDFDDEINLGSNALKTTGNLSDGTNTLTIANVKTAYDHSQAASGTVHGLTLANVSQLGSSIDSSEIANDSIVNADINTSAGIAGTKISPDFGSQNIVTTGNVGIGTIAPVSAIQLNETYTASSGTETTVNITPIFNQTGSASAVGLRIAPTINQTSTPTGGYTGLLVNATETSAGTGTKRLLDLQVGGSTKFNIDNAGNIWTLGNLTLGGYAYRENLQELYVKNNKIYLNYGQANLNNDAYISAVYGDTPTVVSSLRYDNSNSRWEFDKPLNLTTGNTYKIAGTDVLTGSALGTGITASSLTSVGTLTTLNVAGNVGIGTTQPLARLHIKDNGSTGGVFDVHADDQNPYVARFFNDTFSAANPAFQYFAYDTGEFRMGTPATSTTQSFSFYTQGYNSPKMTIKADGNVGIGTTAPSDKLSVYTTKTSTSTAAPDSISLGATYSNSAGTNLKLKVYDDGTNIGGLGISANQMDYKVWANTANHVFYQGTTELMRIKGTGNVGIGTSSPTALLAVGNNAFKVASNGTVQAGTWNGTDIAVADGGTGASDAGTARTNLGLGSIATQASNGVSITGGTITGITDLTVSDGGTGASSLTGILKGNGTSAVTGLSGTQNYIIKWSDSNTLSSTSTIFDNGNVGIGTIAPVEKFEVVGGDAKINGDLNVTGVINQGGTTVLDGSGVQNYMPKWNDSNTLSGSSLIYDTGTNVGIGTTSPGQKLDVPAGYINAARYYTNGNTNTYLYADGSSGIKVTGGYLYAGGSGTSFRADNTANFRGSIANDTAGYLTISGGTSGYTYLSGNVGIGTTAPAEKLVVYGDVTVTGSVTQNGTSMPSGSGTINYIPKWSDASTLSSTSTLFDNGNIGIGTTQPVSKLQVNGGDTAVQTANKYILDSDDSGDSYIAHDNSNDRVSIYVDGVEMVRINK